MDVHTSKHALLERRMQGIFEGFWVALEALVSPYKFVDTYAGQ